MQPWKLKPQASRGGGHIALCIDGGDFKGVYAAEQKLAAEIQSWSVVWYLNSGMGFKKSCWPEVTRFDEHWRNTIGRRIK